MSMKTFLTIIASIGILFGVANLLVPDAVGVIYGTQPSPSAALMARYFGVALLAWAMISWFAREFHDEADLRHILAPSGVAHSLGVIVSASATMMGTMNAMGWTAVAIFLFGAIGSFYYMRASLPHGMVHT